MQVKSCLKFAANFYDNQTFLFLVIKLDKISLDMHNPHIFIWFKVSFNFHCSVFPYNHYSVINKRYYLPSTCKFNKIFDVEKNIGPQYYSLSYTVCVHKHIVFDTFQKALVNHPWIFTILVFFDFTDHIKICFQLFLCRLKKTLVTLYDILFSQTLRKDSKVQK